MTNENTATQGVATEKLGSTLRITMSNPGKKNAIDRSMYLGLAEALTTAPEQAPATWILSEPVTLATISEASSRERT
ncbi:hypothetical protein [Ruegeria lacuscaerulensis]|uniref:hypothetical protein n=1 Tax=Ruegeria lacuscaerulensis TaxID=55218 RepID=UPI00147DD06F|nr:hypothetical protein [Ruegeria lacuscaerulensis]